MSPDSVVSVHDLGKRYEIYDKPQDRLKQSLWGRRRQYFREFWALRNVSFDVARGETIGIIGRNGSGKSTLLQMIAGTLAPTTGQVQTRGRVAALLELGSGFNLDFTGRENVYLNGAILGLTRQEIDERFPLIESFAGIGDFIDQPAKVYSSGMLVRLAFSVSINVDPEILIVDEALAVGDIGFQIKCMERLDQLTRSGITLLFVSHDIGTVKAFCSRAIYLSEGQMKATGNASDMVELFLMDIREAQRRDAAAAAPAVRRKPSVGRPDAVAFGTDQGRVVNAFFDANGGSQWACSTGDPVSITLEVEYDETVKNPAVSLVLHDHRMLDLSGRYFRVAGERGDDGLSHATVRFTLPAMLNNATYYFSVRLEDRASDDLFFPIDKQAGVLQLHVTRPAGRHFLGLIETPIECEQLRPATPGTAIRTGT
ncbi:MAG TPA: ABC transporter ATP-binding protein [Usitatibacter sp.]|nr:ABC transporter ATP-binding protein [Usitatibacter sp.]